MPASIALVDCNNFYASCERVFQPELRGKPVVMLSNNDGWCIARSNEAKALGIEMGAPWQGSPLWVKWIFTYLYFHTGEILDLRLCENTNIQPCGYVEIYPFRYANSRKAE